MDRSGDELNVAGGPADGEDGVARRDRCPPRRGLRRKIRMMLRYGMLLALAAILAGVLFVLSSVPSPQDIEAIARRPSLLITDGDLYPPHTRDFVYPFYTEYSDIPQHLVLAVLTAEDRRFLSHHGVDLRGIARAVKSIVQGELQGASTITQQLVKNLLLWHKESLVWKIYRKLLEIPYSLYLELYFSKSQILEMYLNRVYFGDGIYGVAAAARHFFGRNLGELTLFESAMLARSLRAPSRLNPFRNRAELERRASALLAIMVEEGMITERERKQAQYTPPGKSPLRLAKQHYYFRDFALSQLPLVYDVKESDDIVAYLTIEPRLQYYAEFAVESALRLRTDRDFDQIALVAMTPDGAVRAMVGGADYSLTPWNRATSARRQPGSVFKVAVYLAALEHGYAPSSAVDDWPVSIDGYSPSNIDRWYLGSITLARALIESRNVATVRLSEELGRAKVIGMARRLGIEGNLPDDPTLALGSGELTLLDVVEAFAALANGGYQVRARSIEAIRSRSGRFLYRHRAHRGMAVASKQAVCTLTDLLARAAGPEGTGREAAFAHRAAGKTGTSDHHRDSWFVGFTPQLVAGVWIGNDDDTPTNRLTGSGLAARTWRSFMEMAHVGRPRMPFACQSDPR